MNDRKARVRRLRILTMSGLMGIIAAGMIFGLGTGNLSAGGLKRIYAACPLGYLTASIASGDWMPRLFICFLIIAGITILVGRIFCGWACPVPLLRKLTKNKLDEPNDVVQADEKSSRTVTLESKASLSKAQTANMAAAQETESSAALDKPLQNNTTSYGLPVLLGALASSAVFKFPVFCLICPIGLTFATLFALIRLFGFKDPTLDLLIFPAIILIELLILRKWCSKICPLGALLSLISRLNRRLVPTVDRSVCIEESRGANCQQCRKACPYDIDVKDDKGTGHISECTKCKECAVNCPVQAITFPWKKQKRN